VCEHEGLGYSRNCLKRCVSNFLHEQRRSLKVHNRVSFISVVHGSNNAIQTGTHHCENGVCSTFSSLAGWELKQDKVMPHSPCHMRMKRREEKTQETLTLAVGLWPRTRIAKVFALRLVAVRILLRGIGRRQAIGEAGDGRQALLVRSRRW
jgi:hypothetical protein